MIIDLIEGFIVGVLNVQVYYGVGQGFVYVKFQGQIVYFLKL